MVDEEASMKISVVMYKAVTAVNISSKGCLKVKI